MKSIEEKITARQFSGLISADCCIRLCREVARRVSARAIQHGFEAGRMASIRPPGEAYAKAQRDMKLEINSILRTPKRRKGKK